MTKTKSGRQYLLVICCRFSKLTQVIPLKSITSYHLAVAFCSHWVFKYGPPRHLLMDNAQYFNAKFFQAVCQHLGISPRFITTYHPQTNGQAERYNRTIIAMLRNYVNDHQDDWDKYSEALTYAYNNHVHRSTLTTPFDLVLTRPPPPFSLHHSLNTRQRPTAKTKTDFINRIDDAMTTAYARLAKTQARYKKDYDKTVRLGNKHIKSGDWVLIDNPEKSPTKLELHAQGPFRVLSNDVHTITIDRNGALERVSSDRVTASPPPDNIPNSHVKPKAKSLPPGVALSSEEYVVDRILDDTVDEDGYRWFLTKYYGYAEKSFQPEAALPAEMVSRYLTRKHSSTST